MTTAPARSGRPSLEPGLVVYRFGVGLFYANAARLTEEGYRLVDVPEPPRWLVLLADAIDDVDFTGGKTLVELADELEGATSCSPSPRFGRRARRNSTVSG